jgi:hypothetical protein
VQLPRHSPIRNSIRNGSKAVFRHLTIYFDPILVRVRGFALAQVAARSASKELDSNEGMPLVLLMVYRSKNAAIVSVLLRQISTSADIRLWALDCIVPELAVHTLGCGPGTRFAHLNWLYESKRVPEDHWVAIADDDAFFIRGDLSKTISLMQRARFSLAQPGQSLLGWWTCLFNIARPFVIARDTNFVEQGPILIASSAFARLMFPLPDDGMGWGIEAEWFRIKEGRFRIGIIDACRMIHCSRPAMSYSIEPEMKRLRERLKSSAIDSIWQLRTENGRWWRWQESPQWSNTALTSD